MDYIAYRARHRQYVTLIRGFCSFRDSGMPVRYALDWLRMLFLTPILKDTWRSLPRLYCQTNVYCTLSACIVLDIPEIGVRQRSVCNWPLVRAKQVVIFGSSFATKASSLTCFPNLSKISQSDSPLMPKRRKEHSFLISLLIFELKEKRQRNKVRRAIADV